MKQFSLFDIVGPDMIGPSSSHTAGAARIGFMAARIFGMQIREVIFELHGSFAETYKGHGTDKALLAGVMGIRHNDERLRDAFEIAEAKGLKYEFICTDLGDVYPNTVRITIIHDKLHQSVIQGMSIGGGNAVITKIDDVDVEIDGAYNTLITVHRDQPGMIAKLTKILSEQKINIAFMKLFRKGKGDSAIMVLETDEAISELSLITLKEAEGVYKTTYIPKGGESWI